MDLVNTATQGSKRGSKHAHTDSAGPLLWDFTVMSLRPVTKALTYTHANEHAQHLVIHTGTGTTFCLIAAGHLYSLNTLTQKERVLLSEGAEVLRNLTFLFLSLLFFSESNITVSLSANSSEVLEGDVIQLTCLIQVTTGPLSVSWQWTDKEGTEPAQEVASVDRDGTVWHSPIYKERSSYGEIRVEKSGSDTFTLSVYNALPGDEGQYGCTATEWIQAGTEPELSWEKIGEKSATKTINVKTVGE